MYGQPENSFLKEWNILDSDRFEIVWEDSSGNRTVVSYEGKGDLKDAMQIISEQNEPFID